MLVYNNDVKIILKITLIFGLFRVYLYNKHICPRMDCDKKKHNEQNLTIVFLSIIAVVFFNIWVLIYKEKENVLG